MRKHTPGPWEAYYEGGWWIQQSLGSQVIASLANPRLDDDEPYMPETVEADAMLMAAAPELLAALKLVVGVLISDMPEALYETKVAKRAIRKATGEIL